MQAYKVYEGTEEGLHLPQAPNKETRRHSLIRVFSVIGSDNAAQAVTATATMTGGILTECLIQFRSVDLDEKREQALREINFKGHPSAFKVEDVVDYVMESAAEKFKDDPARMKVVRTLESKRGLLRRSLRLCEDSKVGVLPLNEVPAAGKVLAFIGERSLEDFSKDYLEERARRRAAEEARERDLEKKAREQEEQRAARERQKDAELKAKDESEERLRKENHDFKLWRQKVEKEGFDHEAADRLVREERARADAEEKRKADEAVAQRLAEQTAAKKAAEEQQREAERRKANIAQRREQLANKEREIEKLAQVRKGQKVGAFILQFDANGARRAFSEEVSLEYLPIMLEREVALRAEKGTTADEALFNF